MASRPKEPRCLASVPGLGAPRNGSSSPHAPPLLPGLTGLSFSNSMAVRRAAQQYGLREGAENEDWTLCWTDYSVSLERVTEMKSYQVSGSELILRMNGAPTFMTVPQGDLVGTPMSPIVPQLRLPLQKINHFPGMSEICRKDLLARNMSRMLKMFPKDFHFFPRTWCLPAE